jgi:hypothetical protein
MPPAHVTGLTWLLEHTNAPPQPPQFNGSDIVFAAHPPSAPLTLHVAWAEGASVNGCDADCPRLSVTTTVMLGVVPAGMHEGAVQRTWLLVAAPAEPGAGAPSVPTFALHAKVIDRPGAAAATASKLTVSPPLVVSDDWKVLTICGGDDAVAPGPVWIVSVPELVPPRPSETRTVRSHVRPPAAT